MACYKHMGIKRERVAGFTLIEILVVVFIIAIVALATSLTVGTTRGGRVVRQQADQLQRVLMLVAQTAMIEQVEFGVGFWTNGYAVWKYDEVTQKWVRVVDDRALTAYELPQSLEISLRVNNLPQLVPTNEMSIQAPQIGFSSTGSGSAAAITITNDEFSDTVEILNNGEIIVAEVQ